MTLTFTSRSVQDLTRYVLLQCFQLLKLKEQLIKVGNTFSAYVNIELITSFLSRPLPNGRGKLR